jgi:hypothetical protein
LGGRGHIADCDEGEFHSRFSEAYTITGVYTDPFLHTLAVYERTERAVVE